MQELIEDLKRFNRPIPRYTSYPTAVQWGELTSRPYEEGLQKIRGRFLSLYVHIPFCQTMCLFCGCSVILNRRPENEERYVGYLLREIDSVAAKLEERQSVRQLHFGGGTPTKLSIEQLHRVVERLRARFSFDDPEMSIEIDPRTVYADGGQKLSALKEMGFNRVSFGVQDTDEKVQEAVRRRQSYDMTKMTFWQAKELGFSGINIDLIYGLPYQTVESFQKTADEICQLRPDRIALFSYAKVPWLKGHQLAIKDETLPSDEEKFAIYLKARERFLQEGYIPLGMDHFGLPEDPLTKAYNEGRLHRNFQGYTLQGAEEMVSFGVTAISDLANGYYQNAKELDDYYRLIDEGHLPIKRGYLLTHDDSIRRWTIRRLMCQFHVDKREFEERFKQPFNSYFCDVVGALTPFIQEGMISDNRDCLTIEGRGRLFVRNLVAPFDRYLQAEELKRRFSSAI